MNFKVLENLDQTNLNQWAETVRSQHKVMKWTEKESTEQRVASLKR